MRKRKRLEDDRLYVDSVPSFQQAVKRRLETVLGMKLTIGETSENHKRILCAIGPQYHQAKDSRRRVVVPLSSELWASVEIILKEQAASCWLESTALRIFHGQISDDTKTPLFRAEWDFSEEALKRPHAQPHWQMDLALLKGGVTNLQVNRCHFAICAEWHREGGHLARLDEAERLPVWLGSCLTYVKAQAEQFS